MKDEARLNALIAENLGKVKAGMSGSKLVKNDEFMFQIYNAEFNRLRSQFVTSNNNLNLKSQNATIEKWKSLRSQNVTIETKCGNLEGMK